MLADCNITSQCTLSCVAEHSTCPYWNLGNWKSLGGQRPPKTSLGSKRHPTSKIKRFQALALGIWKQEVVGMPPTPQRAGTCKQSLECQRLLVDLELGILESGNWEAAHGWTAYGVAHEWTTHGIDHGRKIPRVAHGWTTHGVAHGWTTHGVTPGWATAEI